MRTQPFSSNTKCRVRTENAVFGLSMAEIATALCTRHCRTENGRAARQTILTKRCLRIANLQSCTRHLQTAQFWAQTHKPLTGTDLRPMSTFLRIRLGLKALWKSVRTVLFRPFSVSQTARSILQYGPFGRAERAVRADKTTRSAIWNAVL